MERKGRKKKVRERGKTVGESRGWKEKRRRRKGNRKKREQRKKRRNERKEEEEKRKGELIFQLVLHKTKRFHSYLRTRV